MSKRVMATVAVSAVGALIAGTATPAQAAKPEEQPRKPMVERASLLDEDDPPPTFRCGRKTIRFTGGEAIFQTKELPGPRFFGLIKLRNARATDGTTSYAAHGGGSFRGNEESGKFRVSVTFVARGGNVERVNTTVTMTQDGPPAIVNRGTCTVIGF